MSLVINHNTTALNAHRNLGLSANGMGKAIEKLSSGYKINVGADDPSGLIISEQLRSQISGLERAVRNSSEAYNLIGIAEGALNEMNTILKKMRALAIHAASNGVTSPEQVAADQSEMDSGIDTLNRIANTTRYSDQYLLNGAKELVYEDHVLVDEPTDHQMLDTKMTRVDQIFKRDGMRVSIGFSGDESDSKANTENSAKRAYLEADNANGLCQIDGGKLTADQEFTLTGSGGSRMFNFTKGEHIGKMVQGVNNSKDSTGIGAALIFASDVRIDKTSHITTPVGAATKLWSPDGNNKIAETYKKGQIQIYKADLNTNKPKIDSYQVTQGVADAFRVGYNTDGDGKIYAKVVDVASGALEYYKDKECTMLIGKGDGTDFTPANNSGIPGSPLNATEGLKLTINKDNAKALDVYEIAVVGQNMDNDKDMTVTGLGGFVDVGNAVFSGVNLGVNTSAEGKIFFNYKPMSYYPDGEVKTFTMEAYTDGSFDPKYLVGTSGVVTADYNASGTSPANSHCQAVRIESTKLADGQDSGLNITINVPPPPGGDRLPKIAQPGTVEFTNLGVRLYSTDYGSQETIRMQNNKGELFYQYRSHDTNTEKIIIKPDTTVQVEGNDARITVNGSPIYTTGLIANTTTPDFSGSLVFNAGSLGKNTIAVTGYEDGKIYSKATALQGEEEKETDIQRDRRNFDYEGFACSTGGAALPQVYFDLSSLEAMAESKLNLAGGPPVTGQIQIIAAVAATTTTPGQVQFQVNGATVPAVPLNIDYEDMLKGVYLAEPEELKGLFVKIAQPGTPRTSGLPAANPAIINYWEGDPLLEMNSYATQPRGSTSEEMTNFKGGMQFQLGNTEGDQDRTIYSVPSMAMSNMGRIEWAGEEYTLQSVLGGGKACLAKDPVLAMRILAQAVDDVSGLRARLGAFQQNMLQSNMNALEVAVENITKTESAIRDTDMAAESTQFTRFQIMQQAGTSMLAQANQVSQNVLSLLQ